MADPTTYRSERLLWTNHPGTWIFLRLLLFLGLLAAVAVVVAEYYGHTFVTLGVVGIETAVLALSLAVAIVGIVLLFALANLRAAQRATLAEATYPTPVGPPSTLETESAPPPAATEETPPGLRPVSLVPGLGPHATGRLAMIEVETLNDLVNVDTDRIVDVVEIDRGIARQWQRLAELMLVPGVGPRTAELLIAAGVGSIDDLAHERPQDLLARMRDVGRDRSIALHEMDAGPGRVEHWVHAARRHLTVAA